MDELRGPQGRVSNGTNVTVRTRARQGRRSRRFTAVAAMGLTPIVALAWAGCADDSDGSLGGPVYVDPGGTHGAEISVSVIGRGRVTTNIPGLDCPGDCFAKYVFASAGADGAAGAISLKASPTRGSKFKGWSFSTEPVGTRGRGPANCNPVVRAGADPSVDTKALEIELPYGETAGIVPTGQEGPCVDFNKVPVVYSVTATFDVDPPAIVDAGNDGGPPLEALYTTPTVGAVGREIGITQGGYLYWHFTSGGQSGVAYGSNPRGVAPQTVQQIVAPGSAITVFEVDAYGVAYQTNLGAISVIRYGSTTPSTMGGSPPTCAALAVDTSYNVYCRTTSTIVQWLASSGYATPTVLYTAVPSGNDLHVESASGSMTFSSTSAILSLPILGASGADASPTTVVSAVGANSLEANFSRFFWLESGGYVYASSSKSAPTTSYDTDVPPSTLFRHLAEDKNSASFFWVASSSAIYHAYYFGGTGPSATQPFRTGLSGVNGMTADNTYVYTSHSDGTIRRANVSGL
ncbi:MAG: hypothetical protein KF795_04270 [Labilithrix sp.]|nr:hypothetical protein [Labilithrix sp.]